MADLTWWQEPAQAPPQQPKEVVDNDRPKEMPASSTSTGLDAVNLTALIEKINVLEAKLAAQTTAAPSTGHRLDHLHLIVPSDLRDQICQGKFVDLGKLLKKSFLDTAEEQKSIFTLDSKGQLSHKPASKTKADLSISEWTSAMHVYMSVYLQQHPDKLQDMLAYVELIRGAASDHQGKKWLLYDQEFRSRMQADPSRPWGIIDNQIWLPSLSSPQPHLTHR